MPLSFEWRKTAAENSDRPDGGRLRRKLYRTTIEGHAPF
jgi:hypothetical protein